MNYRHAFHAGSFADVLKHAVLALVIEHLKRKEAPFRLIDTHAGSGLYDLTGPEAQRTGEWKGGIGRLWGGAAEPLPSEAAPSLAPYLNVVARLNPEGRLERYPGSPALAAALLRPHDRLTLSELHPEAAGRLAALFSRDRRVKVVELDGWLALGAFVPPNERRGLVLVDPPFEAPGEFARLASGLAKATHRWPSGAYLLWYPVKDVDEVGRFLRQVASDPICPKTLRVELWARTPGTADGLSGAGLLVANPPFTLQGALERLGPVLAERLGQGRGARFLLDWPVREPRKGGS